MSDTPNFQVSVDTRFLCQRLKKAAVGDIVTYADLSAEVGKKVDGSFPALASARRILLREDQRVFDVITGQGLKRLNDVEIVGTSSRTAKRIRRMAGRGVRTLAAVQNFSSLPREEQMRHTAALSVFGVIAEMSGERAIQKVEKIAEGQSGTLPIAQTLDAFRK
ncbi:hypothetical protein JRF84_08030 [Methylobacterium organophilum]|uniref:hypothetical protein n=1 Tax=Methylobacterium TaxID=407 RepID=UPI0019D30646|nr:hypothetical protein [Methylobacterium organophilum]MBN6819536.1 hypothetical protein [Methylobacterium organophilum]